MDVFSFYVNRFLLESQRLGRADSFFEFVVGKLVFPTELRSI